MVPYSDFFTASTSTEVDNDQLAWDRFAASALQGMLANPSVSVKSSNEGKTDAEVMAEAAASLADALIAERSKR